MPSLVMAVSLALNSGGLFQEPRSGMNKESSPYSQRQSQWTDPALRGKG